MSKTQAKLDANQGAFNTQDPREAAAAKRTKNVQHVFSCDLGDGKITHRFIVKRTCNS